MGTTTKDTLKELYLPRPAESKKYDFGLMIVIGGSEFYSGSPALAALAGFRAGLDMARIIAPERAANIIASFSPILASYPLDGVRVEKKHLSALLQMTMAAQDVSHGKTSVVIGGGIGRSPETFETIREYLRQISVPVVIDADAIHAIAETPEIFSAKPFVLTTNTFEFALLTKREIRALAHEERIRVVEEEAKRLGATILLKVHKDIISNGTETAVNETGTPFMTIGGTGDTLAGIAGALLARGIDPFRAARGAAYINGRAGEIASEKFGESLVATDVIDAIGEAIRGT